MNPISLSRRQVLGVALQAGLSGTALRALAQQPPAPTGPFTLPALPYAFGALEPHIDAETMQIHHDRHHQAYVNNLNTAIGKYPKLGEVSSAEALIKHLDRLPEDIRTAVRNNGGGHANHSLFWIMMKPGAGAPSGAIADAINGTFGSLDKFKAAFEDAGTKRFGSGWVWLAVNKSKKLEIVTTPNQDSPLMDGGFPILGNDLWEHAYYLKYRNKRADYLKAWWNVVNWDLAGERLKMA